MSGFKTFAVVGNGNVGSFVIDELLKAKAAGNVEEVVILTRAESANKESTQKFATAGAQVTIVDYANKASVIKALAGIDVVLSTLSVFPSIEAQEVVAEAAKEAGVKLFAPSEYGLVTEGHQGFLADKARFHDKLRALGLPYVLFYTGAFADWAWTAFLNLDVASGKVTVGGNGNSQATFTSRGDIARYVVYVLTNLPAEQLVNRAFRLEGDRKSFNEVFKLYEAKTGKKVEVTYTPIADLQAAIKTNPYDIVSQLHLAYATPGQGVVGSPDNGLYPDWNPTPVIDYLT
ncbi:NAD-P-binding protein [Artomyces pyxidatus]|uniref:NAD-P-binding protein n=1 Tax=Artomyces pyxidatus TaxID=48021 RepID=A0ACB8TGA4_9AGAM|nr:NAD-P-binding protein [Artomyces pyxidatus]